MAVLAAFGRRAEQAVALVVVVATVATLAGPECVMNGRGTSKHD
jgi:hypothetical protein